jgi:sugar porter (SP) family MFS transporter
VAALGGLLFGFDTVVISGTTSALTTTFGLSPADLGFTVSSALWGTIIGALFAGIPGDRIGRRDSLRILAVLYFVSAAGCAGAWDWFSFVFFRFIGGLAIGGSSVLGPMYIAEIAPARYRGRMVGFFQFNVVFGILLAYLSNYLCGLAFAGDAEWRWKLGVAAVPAALFFAFLFGIPRSPRWLASKGRNLEALAVLRATGDPAPEESLREITQSLHLERGLAHEKFYSRKYAFPIFLAVSIGMFNQLSGINAILYYLNDIFKSAGFDKVSSDLQAVAIGFTNLVFTILAMSMIDRLGRKTLLLVGSVGCASALAGVAWVFWTNSHQHLLLWFLILFIGSFAFSQGAVIWVYLSEVFPTAVRARGQSLGSFTHWFMNALISWSFPPIAAVSGAAPFAFFAVMMVAQLFTVLLVYPETKNVTLEQMQHKLGID